jgi:hypothetical protein
MMASVKIPLVQMTDLPPVCVCCGQPATGTRRQDFWVSEALTAAFLASAAALGFVAWAERSITVALPVCNDHRRRGRRSSRTLLWGMVLTVLLGVGAYVGSQFDSPAANYLAVIAMFTFIATLVIGMHEVNDGLAVKALTGDSLMLTGVNRKFVAATRAMSDGPAAAGR